MGSRTLYRGLSIIAFAPVYNEEAKVGKVVRRMPRPFVDEVLIVDDGSTDRSVEVAEKMGATVRSLGRLVGAGAAIREGYRYALERGYDVAVVVAGNNKDFPEEIPLLIDPIAEDRADFVQGSRFLHSNRDFGEMPVYRRIATRLHPLLFSLVARRRVSESTNGFRAIRSSVLSDPRIDLSPQWLDGYELEAYLYLRVIRCGYRTCEVPVRKVYPPKALGQTKMTPSGWWSMLKPLVYLGLGIKH